MSGRYGDRIYVKRRRNINPLYFIIIILIMVASLFFFRSLNKEEPLQKEKKENLKIKTVQSITIKETEPIISSRDECMDSVDNDSEIKSLSEPTVKKVETSKDRRLILAHFHYKNKIYKKALPLYKNLADSNQEALVYSGLCCYWLEDYDNAYIYLEKALKNNIKNFVARKFIAFTSYKMDDLENSLDHAEEGLALLPDPELKALRNKLIREKKVMRWYGSTKKPNFKIMFSKFLHQEVKETVIDILKEAFRRIGNQFNFYPTQPITVILYNEKGFFDVTRAPGWSGGLFDGKIRVPIKGIEGKEELLKRVLFHEYTHALVHAITPRCPHWINEGLAEYFSEDEELLKIGEKLGQVLPLRLLERSFPSGNPRLVAAAYIESYSAVLYLIDKYGLYRVKELLEVFSKGDDLNTAFNSVFHISYDRFINSWGKE